MGIGVEEGLPEFLEVGAPPVGLLVGPLPGGDHRQVAFVQMGLELRVVMAHRSAPGASVTGQFGEESPRLRESPRVIEGTGMIPDERR